MPAGDYIEGVLLFGAMLGGVLAGSWLLVRRRLDHLEGSSRVIAFGLIATLGVIAVHLLPGLVGLLGRGSVLVATGLWVGVAALLPPAAGGDPARLEPGDEDPASAIPAWICVGALATFGLAFLFDQASVAPGSIDVLNFHLPSVARWIDSGSFWQVDNLLPYVAPGNYPNNGDVILLASVLPWHNDFLSHLSMYPFWALTGVAAYALARELGARRSAAALAGSLVVAIPVVAAPALVHSLVDTVMLFGFAAGCAFLLRHNRTGATSDLVLAGLALGLSFGTKWYGVSSVAIVVVVWAGAGLVARRGWRPVLGQGLALTALIALAGGFWMVRNLVESGNPVFPVKVEVAGVTVFDAPPDIIRELGGSTITDYLLEGIGVGNPVEGYDGGWDVWASSLDDDPRPGDAYVLPQLRRAMAAPAGFAVLGLLAAAALLLRKRTRRRIRGRGPWIAAAVAAGLIVVAYSITPYTAAGPEGQPILVGGDSRYVVPAVVLAAALAAGIATWAGSWLTPLLGAISIVAVGDGIRWAARGILTPGRLEAADWVAGGLALALLAAGAWAIVWLRRGGDVGLAAKAAAAALVVVTAGVAVGGYEAQQRFNDDRYTGRDPVVDYIITNAPADQRIGLTGSWDDQGIPPVLPAFGPRFENDVEYVGRPFKEMLYPYEKGDAFAARLKRDRFDYLIVGRGRPGVPQGDEARWARGAGYRRVLETDRFVLMAPKS